MSWFNTHQFLNNKVPSSLAFLTFASVYTLLVSLPYSAFAPRYFPAVASGVASLAIEALTTIFWFCGFIAAAVYVGKLDVCRGTVCGSARGAVVVASLMWVVCCMVLWFPVKYVIFDGNSRSGMNRMYDAEDGSTRTQDWRTKVAKLDRKFHGVWHGKIRGDKELHGNYV